MKIINTHEMQPNDLPQWERDHMKVCEICQQQFLPRSLDNKYCSKPCSMKANNLKQKLYKQQWYLNSLGRTEKLERTSKEKWVHKVTGYIMIKPKGYLEYEHRVLAEKALGKPLPAKAVVHHMGARDDNHGPFKLVICPNQEYHMLLHKRMEELGYGQNN